MTTALTDETRTPVRLLSDLVTRSPRTERYQLPIVMGRSVAFKLGSYTLTVQEPTEQFTEAVKGLKSLLALEPNWDTYGAKQVSEDIAVEVFKFLHASMEDDTPAPHVVPTPSGGIQVEWHEENVDIELEFASPYQLHLFFADRDTGSENEEDLRSDLTAASEAVARLSR